MTVKLLHSLMGISAVLGLIALLGLAAGCANIPVQPSTQADLVDG